LIQQPGIRRLAEFLGLRRSIVGVLGMAVLVGMGEKMAERFLPIYLLSLGGGSLSVGLLNGLDNLLSALYSFPGGYLSERLGAKRALLLFNLVAMAGFVLVMVIPSWPAVIFGAVFFLSWTAISLPGTMGLVAAALPEGKRTMGVTMHSLVRRVPMALGPVIGGLCIGTWGIESGVRVAFGVALALAVVSAVFQHVLIEDDPPGRRRDRAARKPSGNPVRLFREMPVSLRRLLISDILVRFCEQIPYAFVVVWCMKTIARPVTALEFGILTTIEMATAVLIYIPVAYLADRSEKKPFVVATFVFFTAFPLVLYFCRTFAALAAVFVVRGLKEFGEPTRKALIMELAPQETKVSTFGLYYLLRDLVVSVAAFGGAFLWEISPATNFLAAFGCGVAGTLWFAFCGQGIGPENR